MKISAIGVQRNYLMSQNRSKSNFKGIFKSIDESSEQWSYKGCPSGSGVDGNYAGYDSYESYIYYPFKNESEAEIEKVLKENNYFISYDPDSTGGYAGTNSRDTTRGKTLPYTKQEWNRLSKSDQEKIKSLL